MDTQTQEGLRKFILRHRQAALAVVEAGEPFTAMVSYAGPADCGEVYIHLSALSAHKRMLLAAPRCSLLIAKPDSGQGEVTALPRVSLQGEAALLAKDSPAYAQAKEIYLAKLPTSELMFTLPDFDLIRVAVRGGRYIAGFGKALAFSRDELMG